MDSDKFKLPPRYKSCEENVWMEYADLARKYKPLNFGQGAPDYTAPQILIDALEEVLKDKDDSVLHQYTRGSGHLRLVNILSKVYSPLLNKEMNPLDEILITNGASEALYCAIIGIIDVGDEVIIMEPYFDSYEYLVKMAGGTVRYIPLRPKKDATSSSDWVFDNTELESLFNSKTKMIILNTPHNPTGKVYTADELQQVADLCLKWDVLCISDEVYEWMIYKPKQHLRIGALPGMWSRTLTIGSAGKTFSATGWKIGWAFGPSSLVHNLSVIHQNCVYTCCSPLQDALARAFEREHSRLQAEESYFVTLVDGLKKKRDFVAGVLREVGMKPVVPDGGYFMLADYSQLGSAGKTFSATGWKIGWAFGPSSLVHNLSVIHQNCVYTCCSPLQDALARAWEREHARLQAEESYFVTLVDGLKKKRDFVAGVLREVGMAPVVPDGGYFMLADYSQLESKADLASETDKYKDFRFTKWMSKNLGLQGIPLSAFYSEPNKHLGENFVRFCFIKKEENLEKAATILKTWKRQE